MFDNCADVAKQLVNCADYVLNMFDTSADVYVVLVEWCTCVRCNYVDCCLLCCLMSSWWKFLGWTCIEPVTQETEDWKLGDLMWYFFTQHTIKFTVIGKNYFTIYFELNLLHLNCLFKMGKLLEGASVKSIMIIDHKYFFIDLLIYIFICYIFLALYSL